VGGPARSAFPPACGPLPNASAFDDVGNFESMVHDGSPTTAYLTLDPFN
jgi:hypothetical protein